MNPSRSTFWRYLASNPKSCYKQLFIKGTRICARVIFGLYMSAEEPMTPEEIASDFGLPLDAVNEAIAYCQSNPLEIDQDRKREERFIKAGERSQILPPQEIARILKS